MISKSNNNQTNNIYVFIDASNLWQAQKAKGRFFDYSKLTQFIKNRFSGADIKVFYYTAYPADGTRSYSLDGKHKFFTFLKRGLGFEVKKVYIFSSRNNISEELRTGADGYFDVLKIEENIWRERQLQHRA